MVDFSKPTEVPRWADTGAIVVPSEPKKDSGWVAPELPPDTFFNWLLNRTGNWFKWINERTFDGAGPEDFEILAPSGVTDGGSLKLSAADPASATGVGGSVTFVGGDGGGTSGAGGDWVGGGGAAVGGSPGGDATLTGGDGGTGAGGAALVQGGESSNATGAGTATLMGGDGKGVDRIGGEGLLSGGDSTGDKSSIARLRVAEGDTSGVTVRSAEDYLVADGDIKELQTLRTTHHKPTILETIASISQTTTASLASAVTTMRTKLLTSGNMAVGFGPAHDYVIEDSAATENVIVRTEATREGADNSGTFRILVALAGALTTRMLFEPNNGLSIFSQTTMDSELGTAVFARGKGAGGSHGIPTFTVGGAGVYGVGGVGLDGGNGVVAQGDPTAPVRTSLRIVPQDAEATTPQAGDVQVMDSGGKMRVYNGTTFDRPVPQAFAGINTADLISGTVATDFTQQYTVPGDMLTLGSTIRIRGFITITDGSGGGTGLLQVFFGALVLANNTLTTVSTSDVQTFDIVATIKGLGGGALMNATTHQFDSENGSTAAFSSGLFDSAVSQLIKARYDFGNASNTARLAELNIDIT